MPIPAPDGEGGIVKLYGQVPVIVVMVVIVMVIF